MDEEKSRPDNDGRGLWSRVRNRTGTSGAQQPEYPHGRSRWNMGMLNDPTTDEVPGSVLMMSGAQYNRPLGLQSVPRRTSMSSLPAAIPVPATEDLRKRTPNGEIILEPQPEDFPNDPLNWSSWRRDLSLLSIGFFCMLGGGMTPILAAGFNEVAKTFHTTVDKVALTTGLYMLGLGIGNVIMSPTAILYGKRPVYLFGAVLFIATSIWCGFAKSYTSLVVARVLQGVAVSPVECLPSSSIAEIFFLHERAYRLGIYTLLLLGGKNLIPLVSAAIIQGLGWRWVFYIVAMVVAFAGILLFFFVPESFWDRTPHPTKHRRANRSRSNSKQAEFLSPEVISSNESDLSPQHRGSNVSRVRFANADAKTSTEHVDTVPNEKPGLLAVPENGLLSPSSAGTTPATPMHYTKFYRQAPAKSYVQTLKPYSGRLSKDKWWRVAIRPFILFTYPSILWASMVYALSVGWLIVLSESASTVYRTRYYHYSAIETGLFYISPFIGGILGTAVAGKISDIIVRAMSRRNGGVYEPEFRLVMVIPMALATVIGLMGFGWAAQDHDLWIVPTLFFGIISFGCTLGSTTAITFAVDSYRQYAGEALVTMNFSKNVFHGLVFSLFFNKWLNAGGSRKVFLALGGIQLALLTLTIPMYIYGKRARMWTVRKNYIEST